MERSFHVVKFADHRVSKPLSHAWTRTRHQSPSESRRGSACRVQRGEWIETVRCTGYAVQPSRPEQGAAVPDADENRFRCWYLCFGCTLCFLAPAWLGIFLMMLADLMVHFRHHCDVPL